MVLSWLLAPIPTLFHLNSLSLKLWLNTLYSPFLPIQVFSLQSVLPWPNSLQKVPNTIQKTDFNSIGEQDWVYENVNLGSVTAASIDGDSIVYISYVYTSTDFVVAAVNASSGGTFILISHILIYITDPLWNIEIIDTDGVQDIDTPVIVGDGTLLVRIGPNIHRLTSCSSNGQCSGDKCECNSDWYIHIGLS